eukprot:CAMPEP_0182503976 /NCGR_PEP_ID=MMETSP1321-20130603/16346_1 /TAXON_ID=91990 /ORGANISM="Bolidomonas sp., Strain RCC1657" /LENGTH=107 /DNA_ID=CAMNT_0024709233 /DNA_START=193 /DNA_END=513 /DNA_ORIENTATION=+
MAASNSDRAEDTLSSTPSQSFARTHFAHVFLSLLSNMALRTFLITTAAVSLFPPLMTTWDSVDASALVPPPPTTTASPRRCCIRDFVGVSLFLTRSNPISAAFSRTA